MSEVRHHHFTLEMSIVVVFYYETEAGQSFEAEKEAVMPDDSDKSDQMTARQRVTMADALYE